MFFFCLLCSLVAGLESKYSFKLLTLWSYVFIYGYKYLPVNVQDRGCPLIKKISIVQVPNRQQEFYHGLVANQTRLISLAYGLYYGITGSILSLFYKSLVTHFYVLLLFLTRQFFFMLTTTPIYKPKYLFYKLGWNVA